MAIITDTLVELEVEGGVRGLQGEKGDTGNGIESISKTASSDNIDTYTIYFTDGNTTTYNVVNGDVDCTKDVRINGNSVMEDRIVDLQTEGDYDELTNKLVTLSDIPTRVSELVNDEHYIDADVNTLTNYTLATATGSSIELTMNSSTYVVTLNLKNAAGTTISTGTIDLPIESVVVSGAYDSSTKEVVLTLQGGSTVRFSVADLVAGLVSTTDYATDNTGGVIKTSGTYATETSSTGLIRGITRTYQQYGSLDNAAFISKGTLENVITGKELVSKSVNDLTNYYNITTMDNILNGFFGEIVEVIDQINGEVI